jgi:prepilin-type N-terminal cleavage/methylation domain-containing protein
MLRHNQKGDTLVEVLISIAVVATVLGAAYATVNRSFKLGRQSQDRGEALRLLETQVERLKYTVTSEKGNIKTPGYTSYDTFCFNPDANYTVKEGSCTQGLYTYNLELQPNGVYKIHGEWESYGYGIKGTDGVSRDNLDLFYKIDGNSF